MRVSAKGNPMIKAVLFDLDDTLTDRPASLSKYAALFHSEFARLLDEATTGEIESMFIELDEHGYRPRDEVYAGIVERLNWAQAPDPSAHTIPERRIRGLLEVLECIAPRR
jgi:FMN phosphatase YigB (HAD superfamily)